MEEKISKTIEDYLETLFILQRDGVTIVGARLAELLNANFPDCYKYVETDVPRWIN